MTFCTNNVPGTCWVCLCLMQFRVHMEILRGGKVKAMKNIILSGFQLMQFSRKRLVCMQIFHSCTIPEHTLPGLSVAQL